MTTDRRVDPAQRVRLVGEQRVVESFAHAMQALKLIAFNPAGILDDAGDGERVVGSELRQQVRSCGEQLFRAGHVAKVGHRLAGEHRIVGEAALLRALDFGVPIGALDQANDQTPVEPPGGVGKPIDDGAGTLLIGLHRNAKSAPAGE